jgi:hypothetical protein
MSPDLRPHRDRVRDLQPGPFPSQAGASGAQVETHARRAERECRFAWNAALQAVGGSRLLSGESTGGETLLSHRLLAVDDLLDDERDSNEDHGGA